jgi:hypothetical protein
MERRAWVSVLLLLISAGIAGADPPSHEAREGPSITVRLYDYVEIKPDTLSEAQRVAAGFYGAIGVTVEWEPTLRLQKHGCDGCGSGRLQDFTINILNRAMVARGRWPKDAVGMAAVAPEGGGKIAYVLYDRLRDASSAAGWSLTEFLGVVIAHELGHLLLPPGSHSSGLMRANWDIADPKSFNVHNLAFTPQETALIRSRIFRMLSAE